MTQETSEMKIQRPGETVFVVVVLVLMENGQLGLSVIE